MIFPYGIQSYTRADLPKIRLTNLFVEETPSSRVKVTLLPRPGMDVYQDMGTGPIRAVFSQPGSVDGSLFSLSGTALYSGATSVGTIPGSERVSIAGTIPAIIIGNDTGLFSSDGATVSAIAFPDDAGVSSVAYINGLALALRSNSRRIYFTQDITTWDALDYLSAETSTGNGVALAIVNDQVWAFCERVTEIYVTTGDAALPLQRIEGRLYDQGCLARDTIVKMDNSIVWVGHDFKVYRGDSQPVRISDNGIEEAIQNGDVADLRAWAFPWDGHLFYALTTSSGTKVYDVATQQWTAFDSYGRDAWRAHVGVFRNGEVIAGDDELGRLWKLTKDNITDGDALVERRFTVLTDNETFVDNIVLDCSTGETASITTAPVIECRVSRDQGMTFGNFRQASLGKQGQYRKRAVWRRFGMVDGDGMAFDFRMTDPTYFRVSAVRMNEGQGGRGRPA